MGKEGEEGECGEREQPKPRRVYAVGENDRRDQEWEPGRIRRRADPPRVGDVDVPDVGIGSAREQRARMTEVLGVVTVAGRRGPRRLVDGEDDEGQEGNEPRPPLSPRGGGGSGL